MIQPPAGLFDQLGPITFVADVYFEGRLVGTLPMQG